MEKIAHFDGHGRVFSGDQLLGECDYDFAVYQEYIEGQTMQGSYRVPGMKEIAGTVRGVFPIGSLLKLETREGHTLDFFITDGNGSIAASGPFLKRDGKPVV